MYFDNASTSWPKPKEVFENVKFFFEHEGSNYLRSSNVETEDLVYDTRVLLSNLLNIQYPNQIIFTQNGTEALNLVIYGFLELGDHVITTKIEHNSVIRPLIDLEKKGKIQVSWVDCKEDGTINSKDVQNLIKENTKLIIISHISNVLGSIQPVNKIGEIAKENNVGFLLDASQSIGHIEIDNSLIAADFIAFSGHKGLYGPPGTGALYISENYKLEPIKRGGTGILSELIEQPEGIPLRYESGTLNTMGIAGLNAGIRYINKQKISNIQTQIFENTIYLRNKLKGISKVLVYGSDDGVGIVAFNILGYHPGRIGYLLNEKYNIKVRTGLHCSPFIHKLIGTESVGTIRSSISCFTTKEQIDYFINAINEITQFIPDQKSIKIETPRFPS